MNAVFFVCCMMLGVSSLETGLGATGWQGLELRAIAGLWFCLALYRLRLYLREGPACERCRRCKEQRRG